MGKYADASQILNGLWIGNEKTSQHSQFFKDNNIKAVLNCTPEVPNKFINDDVEYMRLTLGDSRDPSNINSMTKYLEAAASFIYKNHDIEGKNILIHCHQGIQRSVTSVAAYLCKYKGMQYKDIVRFLPFRRKEAFYEGTYLTFEKPLKNFCKNTCQVKAS